MIERRRGSLRRQARRAVERQDERDIVAVEIAGDWLINALHSMTEAAAARHHIEVGNLAGGEPRRCRDVAGKTDRLRSARERQWRMLSDRQHQTFSLDDR